MAKHLLYEHKLIVRMPTWLFEAVNRIAAAQMTDGNNLIREALRQQLGLVYYTRPCPMLSVDLKPPYAMKQVRLRKDMLELIDATCGCRTKFIRNAVYTYICTHQRGILNAEIHDNRSDGDVNSAG